MEKLFDDNINWSISRYSKDSQLVEEVKGDSLLELGLKHQFYSSNAAWSFSLEKLVLKSSLEFYFSSFFDPTQELLGIALFWDCTGSFIVSEASPIYISKKNSRKLHCKIEQKIPKGIKGALVVQFFVLEQEFDLDFFLINLDKNTFRLEEQINTNSFKNCADLLAKAFLETTKGQELFRKNYPSFCLNPSTHYEEETLFYNLVIHMTT